MHRERVRLPRPRTGKNRRVETKMYGLGDIELPFVRFVISPMLPTLCKSCPSRILVVALVFLGLRSRGFELSIRGWMWRGQRVGRWDLCWH